jgi:hypothetical protein
VTPKVSARANLVGVDNAAPLGRETGYILAVGRIKPGRLESAEDTPGEAGVGRCLSMLVDEAPPQEPSSNEMGQLIQLMSSQLEAGLKQVSLAAWRDTSLEPVTEGFRNVVASEGIERIIDELRRAPTLASLEGGMIAIEVDPTDNPAGTYIHWQDRMPAEFEARMRSASAQDPTRPFQSRLPVGLAFDLRDIADKALLSSSEVYTSIYDTLDDSWVSVVLERTTTATWLLTCWHRITKESHRVHLRTALQRLAGPLRVAFHRIGLFGEVAPLRVPKRKDDRASPRSGRNRFVRGCLLDPVRVQAIGFSNGADFATIALAPNHSNVKDVETPALTEWTLEELKVERERLAAALQQVDEALLQKLEIADAIPVRELRHGVRLIDRFETDPRPLLIYVEGTDRHCLLRPAASNSGASDTVLISSLSQRGSELARRAAEYGELIAIRRGRGRTERIVAELAPADNVPRQLIDVLVQNKLK